MTNTEPRVRIPALAPEYYQAMLALHRASSGGPGEALWELVRIRASQLNGCAYCLDMHTRDARAAGEAERRIHLLPVWRDSERFYTEKEQAALALTEAVTLLAEGGVPDEVYERAAKHFPDAELAQLISVIVTINAWNRIGVATRLAPGE